MNTNQAGYTYLDYLMHSHDELYHYGVKGMKWGVRRYQNRDGTRTELGKKKDLYRRRKAAYDRTAMSVQKILNKMSDDDIKMLSMRSKDDYLNRDQARYLAKRILVNDEEGNPVSFVDLLEDTNGNDKSPLLTVSVGTKRGDKYRRKGYAKRAVRKAIDWYDKNSEKYDYSGINWGAKKENRASQKLAETSGFSRIDRPNWSDEWEYYYYDRKR